VLWKKVLPRLSAGRVQSVATRLVVERERDRMAFRVASWHDVEVQLEAKGTGFPGSLVALDSVSLAEGRDFDSKGQLTGQRTVRSLSEAEAASVATGLAKATPTVTSVSEKPFTSKPQPPFMTSTLQQEAGRKLRLSSQMAMRVAQKLYEDGWITYMRTDSTTLSAEAIKAARDEASSRFGADYIPDTPRRYDRKVKNAQEAHEAIRPAGESFRSPEEAARSLRGDELRLYELIADRNFTVFAIGGVQFQLRPEADDQTGQHHKPDIIHVPHNNSNHGQYRQKNIQRNKPSVVRLKHKKFFGATFSLLRFVEMFAGRNGQGEMAAR
jgi:DNA topoisomerase-1